jgi:hypothetical protein
MMDEFIHSTKPYLLLSTTFDEIWSWMIEIWMKHHLVSHNNRNLVDSTPNYEGWWVYFDVRESDRPNYYQGGN